VADKLAKYRGKRDPDRTPEPVPADGPLPEGNGDTFVIQEHHARALHWDVRLERDGVLVSWAVPKGLPLDPKTNHLAVHTEDHPLEYASFGGEIPRGEYGGGRVMIWDRGRYTTEKWTDTEVKVVLDGARVSGRYVFFRVREDDWMVHRMDPPPRPDWRPVPAKTTPMRPVTGPLPGTKENKHWGYEMDWGGEPAIAIVEGGRARVEAAGEDVTTRYPELRVLGPALGSRVCVFDGVVVVLDQHGRPSPQRLRERREATAAQAQRRSAAEPVTYLVADLLHLDGQDTTTRPYAERRQMLDEVLPPGKNWHLSPMITDGPAALAASRDLGLPGIVAKRLDSTYRPGARSDDWRSVSNLPTLPVVVAGWLPAPDHGGDQGPTATTEPAALILGVPTDDGLAYAGVVRTGLTAAARAELAPSLRRLARKTPPFTADAAPALDDARWVRPSLAGEVSNHGWTTGGTLRRPSWIRLLADGDPAPTAATTRHGGRPRSPDGDPGAATAKAGRARGSRRT
jgi:bifunctional non-homologous end joining protein LigD